MNYLRTEWRCEADFFSLRRRDLARRTDKTSRRHFRRRGGFGIIIISYKGCHRNIGDNITTTTHKPTISLFL